MFLDFYQMKDQPFGVTPDPRFLYLGKSHREALASLYYSVESDRGFVALIAQPGLGKTTLTFQLLEKLQQDSRTVFLFQTQCNSKELFHYLLNGLGVDAEGMELVTMHNKLNQILSREMLAGRRFVLAIDEAQNLAPEVLETIRLLSNFETSQSKLLQILLIGQPQLAQKLARPELEQLQQRISMFAKIDPFGSEDISRYIGHCLQVAGYTGSPLFTPDALRIITEQSQGIPRKINALCFSALSLGCAMGRKQVDAAIMEEVIADRDMESLQRPRAARRVAPASATTSPAKSSPLISPPAVSLPVASRPILPSPVTSRPALSTYSTTPKRSFGRWATRAVSVAALVAIVVGILSLSPDRIDRFIHVSTGAWSSIRNAAASLGSSTTVKSNSGRVQAAELPKTEAGQPSPQGGDVEINTVIVQLGDTLRQIMLRANGTYNEDTVEQIQKLNPDISDFGHLEAGQQIRLPRPTAAVDSATASAETSTNGKN